MVIADIPLRPISMVAIMRPVDRSQITPELPSGLVADEFPQWADLPVHPLDLSGTYVPQVSKEHYWLLVLAPRLPPPVPLPLARSGPGQDYLWPWSVYRWLDGERWDFQTRADKSAHSTATSRAAWSRRSGTPR